MYMNFLINYLKGFLIGSGAILPGISSGVLCVILGIYEKLVNIILHFFKDFKKNLRLLFPLLLGGISGILLFSKILNSLFIAFPIPTKFCFIGLILGSLPILIRKANNKNGFRLHYLIFLLSAFFIGFLFIKLNTFCPSFSAFDINTVSFIYLFLVGFFMSIGVVIPGISSSVILITFGIYNIYLEAIANINFSILIPLGLGLVCGGILFLNIIKYLLNKYYSPTFYAIIGFVIGSILILYSKISFNFEGFISIFLMILGFVVGLNLEKLDKNNV